MLQRNPPHLEGARDDARGLYISKYPDVCRSPHMPVPYTIVAFEGDDINTEPTVRYTGRRAHTMGSLVSRCTGDEPGTGLGVLSGTVGSVCHPKGHSCTVRVGGEWAVRDRDDVWMNDRNTIGKRVRPGSTEGFRRTPPFLEQARTYAAAATPAATGPAAAAPLLPASGQRAAAPAPRPAAPSPRPAAPLPRPPGPGPADVIDFEEYRRRLRPPEPPRGNRFWNGVRWVLGKAWKGGKVASPVGVAATVMAPTSVADATLPNWEWRVPETPFQRRLYEIARERHGMGVGRIEIEEYVDAELARERALRGTVDAPPEVETEPGVSVRRDDDEGERNCRLRPYKEGCADALPYATPHHIVADRSFRKAGSSELYPGGVPHADGLTICVAGPTVRKYGPNATEHGLIHLAQDTGEQALGQSGTPPGTATLGALEANGVAAAAAVTKCDPVAMAQTLRAYHQGRGLGPELKFRADPFGSINPPANGLGIRPDTGTVR